MSGETLFVQTIRYLKCLYTEGFLTPEKLEKLARFTLELEKEPDKISDEIQTDPITYSSDDDVMKIISMVSNTV